MSLPFNGAHSVAPIVHLKLFVSISFSTGFWEENLCSSSKQCLVHGILQLSTVIMDLPWV